MNCVFCEIISGQSPAEIIYNDEEIISFLDIRPMNLGHTLVVPKFHSTNFLDVPDSVIPSLFRRAQQITKAISEALEPDGINLVMNNGAAAGQSVFHCHLHIIPRFNHDEFKFRLHFKKYQSEQRSEFGKLIRECL